MDASTSLEIRLFGPFEAEWNGQSLPKLRTKKGRLLLAFMALHYRHGVERDACAAALWPEPLDDLMNRSTEKTWEDLARQNLDRTLSDLRRALGDNRCGPRRLRSPGHGLLQLDMFAGDEIDIKIFDQAIQRGDIPSLHAAVALYRRPLLDGWGAGDGEEWICRQREDYAQKYAGALNSLCAHAMAAMEYEEALGYLRRLIHADVLEEAGWRELMQGWISRGEGAQANSIYQELSRELRKRLLQPSEETRAVWERIPEQERTALNLTNRPYQHTNLPYPITSLIGREEDLDEIKQKMGARLVSLIGSGGVGKTRLAVELAHRMRGRYRDDARFVDLSPLSDAALIPSAIASALGIQERPDLPLKQALIQFLRAKEMLLLLDNCEHLVEPCAELAAELLNACPNLHILTTSRQSLGIAGEVAWLVPSLSFPDSDSLPPNELLRYTAIELFLVRARETGVNLALTPSNATAIVQICRRLDGIPLALELAATHVKALSPEEIAARLQDRFRLLTDGNRRAPPRQQTLRAVIDWSYSLLPKAEQDLLCRLSVFVGGGTLEAAEAVCANEASIPLQIETLLSALIDKSLVVRSGEVVSRYRLLETIREYSQERLVEAPVWRKRHRDYFLALAEDAEAKLKGAEQGECLQRLEAEHGNLRAALEWSLLEAESTPGLRFCGALQRFWLMRGHFSEGREWCVQAMAKADAQKEWSSARARALNTAGLLALYQGDYPSSIAYNEESLAIHKENGDTHGVATSLFNLARIPMGAPPQDLEQILAMWRTTGDRHGIAAVLGHLGVVASVQGDEAYGMKCQFESLAIKRKIGDLHGIAVSQNNLGHFDMEREDYDAAHTRFVESLELRKKIGDRRGIALTLHNLGSLACRQDECGVAFTRFEESLDIHAQIGDKHGVSKCLAGFAHLAVRENQWKRAAALSGATEALCEEVGVTSSPREQAEYECDVAKVRQALGEEAFSVAWEKGRSMTLEQAIEYALKNSVNDPVRCGTGKPAASTSVSAPSAESAALPSAIRGGLR